MDIALNSLNKRFTPQETDNKIFQFIYYILKPKDIEDKKLENYRTNLQSKMKHK